MDSNTKVLYHPMNKQSGEPSIWIEIFYSTLVEAFSTADLYTDIIIMRDLYLTGQQWWTSWMIFLVLAPYLVSYSALTSLIDNAMFQYQLQSITTAQRKDKCTKTKNSCTNILILFIMTPLCVLYLIIIDMTFMVYVLLSTLCLLITCRRVDIRHLIDDYIFRKLFKMNKTQIVGYRRLRTLSQLLFETTPQILLQMRILIEIKMNDDVDYYINEMTIIWSIIFAALHLLLEYTIITLDAKALQMSFTHYAFICLGARLNWIPYGHLLDERCNNVESIENSIDLTKQISICASSPASGIDTEYSVSSNIFDYNKIDAGLFGFQYKIEYEFSEESITRLAEYLTYLPIPSLPAEFNSIITSPILYSLFNDVLLAPHQVEIKLGGTVCKNVDLFNLLELYRSSMHKVNLNINTVDTVTIIRNTKGSENFKKEYREHILNEFVYYCNLKLLDCLHEIHPQSSVNLKEAILKRALGDIEINTEEYDDSAKHQSGFNILRKCYKNGVLFGLECDLMKKVYDYVEICLIRSENEEYYIYVAMLILFYSQKNIHHHSCSFGCCTLQEIIKSTQLQQIFDVYLPQSVKFENLTISLELLQCFDVFESHFEEILLNMCKEGTRSSNQPPQSIPNALDNVYSRTMIPIMTQNSMDQLHHLLFSQGKRINIKCEWPQYFNKHNEVEIRRMDRDAFLCFVNDAMNHNDTALGQINKDEVLCYLKHIEMNEAMFMSMKKKEFNKQLIQECNVRRLYDMIANHQVTLENYTLNIDDIYVFKWIKVKDIKTCTKKQLIYMISLSLDLLIKRNILTERSIKHTILLYLQSQYINGVRFESMTADQFVTFIMQSLSGINRIYSRELYDAILGIIINIEMLSDGMECFLPNIKMYTDSRTFKWNHVAGLEQCTNKQFMYIVSLKLDKFIRSNIIPNRSVKTEILFYLQQQRTNGSEFTKMSEPDFTQNIMQSIANNALLESLVITMLYAEIMQFNFESINAEDDCVLPSYRMTQPLNDDSIAKLDSIVYTLKMSREYQSYLHNTKQYRNGLKVIEYKQSDITFTDENVNTTFLLSINDALQEELFTEHNKSRIKYKSYLQIFNIKVDIQMGDVEDNYNDIEVYFKYSNGQNIKWNKAVLYKGILNYDKNHFVINIENNFALGIYNKMLLDVQEIHDIYPIFVGISGDNNNIRTCSYDLAITVANLQISDNMKQSIYSNEVMLGGEQLQYQQDIAVTLDDNINTKLLPLAKSFEISEIGLMFYLISISDDGITKETYMRFKSTLPREYQAQIDGIDWKRITGDDGILQLDEFFELLDQLFEDDRYIHESFEQFMKISGHIRVSLYETDEENEKCMFQNENYSGSFMLDAYNDKDRDFSVILDENTERLNEYLRKNKKISNLKLDLSVDKQCRLGYNIFIKHSNRRSKDTEYRKQSLCIHHDEISFTTDELEYKDDVMVTLDGKSKKNNKLLEFIETYQISQIVFKLYLIHEKEQNDDITISGNVKLCLNKYESYNDLFTLSKDATKNKFIIIIKDNIIALNDCIVNSREFPEFLLEISADAPCDIAYDILLKGSNYRTFEIANTDTTMKDIPIISNATDQIKPPLPTTSSQVFQKSDYSDTSEYDGYDYSFIPLKRLSDIRNCGDLYIYLKQRPRTMVAVGTMLFSLILIPMLSILYSVGYLSNVCYHSAAVIGIVCSLYGFCHFRTMNNLNKHVNEYFSNNKMFAQENYALTNEVRRISVAKNELKSTSLRIKVANERQKIHLAKFREVNANCEAFGIGTATVQELVNWSNLSKDYEKEIQIKWKESVISYERKILHVCFDRFEWDDIADGISRKQFIEFKLTLPMSYQLRLTRAGDWQSLAGDDGILPLDEFIAFLDKFAVDEVNESNSERGIE